MEQQPDYRPSVELLESTHAFPGRYTIKAIGAADDDFERRVVAAVSRHLESPTDLEYSVRAARGGRHVAVTLDLNVRTAEQVRSIYGAIHEVQGLKLLF